MFTGLTASPRKLPYPTSKQVGGIDILRFVFQAGSEFETVEDAFRVYDPIIESCFQQGIKALLILGAETLGNGGYGPGRTKQPPQVGGVSYEEFAVDFADACRKIAVRYGEKAVYQIWNEGDVQGGESSTYYPPAEYGVLLRACVREIKAVSPRAIVISQGHATGGGNVRRYWAEVVRAGTTGVDAIAVHPYGQYVGSTPEIDTAWFPESGTGRFGDYLSHIRSIGLPIWITEIGVSEHRGFPAEQYPRIAAFMVAMWRYLRDEGVAAFVWFAYHNGRGAGLVDDQNVPKPHVFDAFRMLPNVERQHDLTPIAPPQPVMMAGRLMIGAGGIVNVRQLPSTRAAVVAKVADGDILVRDMAVQKVWDDIAPSIGIKEQWYAVRISSGKTGFIRHDLVAGVN